MYRSTTEVTQNLPSVMNAETIMYRIGTAKNISSWCKIDDERVKAIRSDRDYLILHVTDNAYSYTTHDSMKHLIGQESGALLSIADVNALMRRIIQWSLQTKLKTL